MEKNTFTVVADIRQFTDKATEESKDYMTYYISVDEVEVIMTPKQLVGRKLLEREVQRYGHNLNCFAVQREYTDKVARETRKYWTYYVKVHHNDKIVNVPVAPKEKLGGELLELELVE